MNLRKRFRDSMINRTSFLLSVLILILTLPLAGQIPDLDRNEWRSQKIDRGLYWRQLQTDELLGGPQNINILRVKTNRRPVDLAYTPDSLLQTSTLGSLHQARAAVNGSFFNAIQQTGITFLKSDGKVVAATSDELDRNDPELAAGAFVVTDRGRVLIEPTRPKTFYELSDDFQDVLLTGPLLIVDGTPRALAANKFNDNRHPRTCACKTRKNELLLVTIDGRNAQARGMTLDEATRLLLALGCKQAVNLDGGGSTTMWIAGQNQSGVVNRPSDNGLFDHAGERRVANAILIR